MTNNRYLVWLEWPEKCFRVDAKALGFLRELVPAASKVIRARSEASFLRELPKATHVITWHFKAEWFDRAGKLRVLATPGAGRELVSANAPRGVKVHFGHFHGAIISETVAGFMLAWAHGMFRPELAEGSDWPRVALSDKCFTIADTQALIVGYGRIGRAIGGKLSALGVRVAGFGRKNIKELPRRAKSADWLILALPSDTGTDDLVSKRLLSLLPRRAVVVNVGRGNAIDENALLDALRRGRIAGAYLDVFKNEPGPLAKIVSGNRLGILSRKCKDLPRGLIRMPHSSAFSADYLRRCFLELKDDGCI